MCTRVAPVTLVRPLVLLPVVAIACTRETPKAADAAGADAGSAATVTPSAAASATPDASFNRRCLPVVAKACGCTYSCGVGVRDGDHWTVRHKFWTNAPLRAQVTSWCVSDQCTDAFDVQIVCDGICAPRPADPTCHFDGAGACVGR
jgi:hypothetical protein